MLSPARILAIALRWLALGCGVVVAISGAATLLHLDKGIGATSAAIVFVAAILLWSAGAIIDYWLTRHARRRLREMLTMVQIQDGMLPDAFLEEKELRSGGTLRVTQLATASSSESREFGVSS